MFWQRHSVKLHNLWRRIHPVFSLVWVLGLGLAANSPMRAAPADPPAPAAPHHFQRDCANCHLGADPAQPGWAGKLKMSINQACTASGCHNLESGLNHPVDVRAEKAPQNLPLDDSSRITCLTCHQENAASASPEKRTSLRLEARELCGSCHRQGSGNSRARLHWESANKAHLAQITTQKRDPLVPAEKEGAIDQESRSCLACHDRVTVTIPGENEAHEQRQARRQNMSNHPIGMSYGQISRSHSRDFKSPLALGPRVRLFEGRVGCGSCHSPYSATPKLLVDRCSGCN